MDSLRPRGFTLTEMAVVLAILALLIGGMILPLSAQQDLRHTKETESILRTIHEALIGYASIHGRLPCPASITSNGLESFASGGNKINGNCSNFLGGFLPAVTLGIQPTDQNGFAIDSWGNRIRYSVADAQTGSTRILTGENGIKLAGSASFAAAQFIAVCTSATGIDPADTTDPINYCGSAIPLSLSTPAVIFSTGKNGEGSSADERANTAIHDVVFVFHNPTTSTDPNGQFDDMVMWLSPGILINRMVAAGRLP